MKLIRGIGVALVLMACVGVTFAVTVIITTWALFHNPPEIITEFVNQIIAPGAPKGENK